MGKNHHILPTDKPRTFMNVFTGLVKEDLTLIISVALKEKLFQTRNIAITLRKRSKNTKAVHDFSLVM